MPARVGTDTSAVLFVVVVLTCALLVGALAGGDLRRLSHLHLRDGRLVAVALALQVVGAVVGGAAYPLGLALSAALVVTFLLRNRGVRGTGLVGLGLLANALVVSLNGAMPVSAEASGRAGVTTQAVVAGTDPRHELSDDHTRVPWLADVIPVPLPLRPEVVSPGDVLIAAGLAQLLVVGMTRRPRRLG